MIAPMKKLLLDGRTFDREKILEILHLAGVIHVDPIDGKAEVSPDLKQEIIRIQKALAILEGSDPTGEGMAPPGTPARLVGEIHKSAERLNEVEMEIISLNREKDAIAPWGKINFADIDSLRKIGLDVGLFIGSEDSLEAFTPDLKQEIKNENGIVYSIGVSKNKIEPHPGLTRIDFPKRDMVSVQAKIDVLVNERNGLKDLLNNMAKRQSEIEKHLEERCERQRFAEVEAGLRQEEVVFILQGWVPASQENHLVKSLEEAKIPLGINFEDPDEESQPPTQFDNPWWCKPVEYLYDFLGVTPGYREPEISPTFFPAMIIFAGMLIADAGYGFVALLGLALAYPSLVSRGTSRELLHLCLAMMSGVVIYGAFTNTYFGEPLIRITSIDGGKPDDIKFLQQLCFILGSIHLTVAHIWKAKCRPIGLQTLSDAGWVIFIWAMYSLVCVLVLQSPVPFYMKPMFGISTILIVFFTDPAKGFLGSIGSGIGDFLLNATAFLSDIISYIRLWAVGLAGGVLAHSFNELARPLPLVFCIIVMLTGHTLNFLLGCIAILAHGVRLNLLEFSNHLGMEWTGREYRPFRKK